MPWTFYSATGQKLTSAVTSINVLDIDGATDIGAAIVDADLFIIDDGAGGTNRKTAASRIKTYAGVTQADQAALEAETDEDTYVPPDLVKNSPGVAKCWGQNTGAGALSSPSYNVASLTDTGVGSRVYVWTTDFSSAVYSTLAAGNDDQFEAISIYADNQAAGSCTVKIRNSGTSSHQSGAFFDTINSIVAYGDQ